MFLMETKLTSVETRHFWSSEEDFELYVVDSTGRAGGLCLLWKKGINFKLFSSSLHHIDGSFEGFFGDEHWRFSSFYGWSNNVEKHFS